MNVTVIIIIIIIISSSSILLSSLLSGRMNCPIPGNLLGHLL